MTGGDIFFNQAFQGYSKLVDCIWWRELKGLCECLIRDGKCVLCNLTKVIPYALFQHYLRPFAEFDVNEGCSPYPDLRSLLSQ